MKFYEKNLEDLIYEHCQSPDDKQMLVNRGFPDVVAYGTTYRQFNFDSYGIADLVTIQKPLVFAENKTKKIKVRVDIFELKLSYCDLNTLLQLSGYMSAARHIISHHLEELIPSLSNGEREIDWDIFGHLIGTELKPDLEFVLDNTPKIFFTEYDFCLKKGMTFHLKGKNWRKTKFNINNTSVSNVRMCDLIQSELEFDEYMEIERELTF